MLLFQTECSFKFFSGECNYGGRVTDDKDRRLLLSLLSIFYNWDLIQKEGYQLCEGGLYYVPAHSPYQVISTENVMLSKHNITALGQNGIVSKDTSNIWYFSFCFRSILSTFGPFRYVQIHLYLDFTVMLTSQRTNRRPISS